MKKDYFNTFEESDFRICEDMEFNSENKNIFIPMEAWFDVDKKFGITSASRSESRMLSYRLTAYF